MQQKVIILTGPTASGKSHLALNLAKESNGLIINADSMQVYKDLPILSAQPTLKESTSLPHHLYGFLGPREPYDALTWSEDVIQIITTALQQNKTSIIVGGTGFYIKALCEGFSPIPPIPECVRKILWNKFEADDPYHELKAIDPLMATFLNPKDRQRILRALEVKIHTGISLKEWQSKPRLKKLQYPYEIKIINPSKEILESQIRVRILKMIEQGVIEEVESLMNQSLNEKSMIFKTLGYQEIKGYLLGQYSKETLIQKIHIKTRQYAKRQRTWIRHQIREGVFL